MGYMGLNIDVVATPAIMEAIADAAEDGECMGLSGSITEDAGGTLYRVTASTGPEIGLSMVCPDGGVVPTEDMLRVFRERIGKGVLAVVDPYDCSIALYVVDCSGYRVANSVLEE